MIATDLLSLIFIFCFLLGFGFFLVSALTGSHTHGASHGVGHVHVPAISHTHGAVHTTHAVGQPNGSQHTNQANATHAKFSLFGYLNPLSIALFLLGFGLFGYFFHNLTNLIISLTLALAVGSGLLLAILLLLAINRIFLGSEGSTEQDVTDRTGMLGKVSITIPEEGIGEIIYTSPGGLHKSIAARSISKQSLQRDQEVVVVNYQNGIAEVDTWDHFMHESNDLLSEPAGPEPNEQMSLSALTNKPDNVEKERITRKDMQKE